MQNQNIHSWPWGQGPGPAFQGAQSILPTNFPPPGVDQSPLLPGYPPVYGSTPGQQPPGYNQWTAAQLQQWQQWQQWQEKYQQWQAQYGKKYAESLAALGQNPGLLIHSLPPMIGVPKPVEPVSGTSVTSNPPLPVNNQPVPPPPPDEEKPPLPFSTGENSGLAKSGSRTAAESPEELSEAEKTFDIQFKQWEGQFNEWKKQNQNHPDKAQYREYEKKWETWREQLLQRREQMRKKRLSKCVEQASDGRIDESRPKPVPAPVTSKPTASEYNYKTRAGGESSLGLVSLPVSGSEPQSSLVSDPPKFENKGPFFDGKPQDTQTGSTSVGDFVQHPNFLQEKNPNQGQFSSNNSSCFEVDKIDPSKGNLILNSRNFEKNQGPSQSSGSDKNFNNQGPNIRFENYKSDSNNLPFNSKFRNPTFEGPRGTGNLDGNYGPRHRFLGCEGRNFAPPPRFPGNERDNFSQQRFPGVNRDRNTGGQNFGHLDNSKPFTRGGSGSDSSDFRSGNGPPDMHNPISKPKVPSLFDITVEKPPGLGGSHDRKPKIWEKYEKDDYFDDPFDKRQEERDIERNEKPWLNSSSSWGKRDGGPPPSPWMQPWEIEKLASQKAQEMRSWDRGAQMDNRPWLNDSPAKKELDKAELSGYVGNILAKLGNFNVMPPAMTKIESCGNGSSTSLLDTSKSTMFNTGMGLRNSEDEQNMPKNNIPPTQSGCNNFQHQGHVGDPGFGGSGPKDVDQRVNDCGDRLPALNSAVFPPTNFDYLVESGKDTDERIHLDGEPKNFDVDERISDRDDRPLFHRNGRNAFGRDELRNLPRPVSRDDMRNFGNESRFFGRGDRSFGKPGRNERGFGRLNCRDDVDNRFGGRSGRRGFDGLDRDDRNGKFFDRHSGSLDRLPPRGRDQNEPVWNPQVFDYSQGRPLKLADPNDSFKISTVVDYSHGEKKQTFDYGHGEVDSEGLEMRSFDYGHKSEALNVIDYGHGVDNYSLSKDFKRDRPPRDGEQDVDERSKSNPVVSSPVRSRSPRSRLRSHSRSPHSKFKKESDSPPFRGGYKDRRSFLRCDRNGSEDKLSPADGDLSRHSFDVTTVLVEDLICLPGRETRPNKLVFIMRGLPGSGKTYVTKLIKDKEVELGVDPPRILSLDDYFMTETEKEITDKETGRKVKTKVLEYEYEAGMEPHYRGSLLKAFKKTVSDGFFSFIIVDSVNEKTKDYEEMWSFAKQKGFQVYIAEMDNDVTVCKGRNIHKRTEKEILDLSKAWEETPSHYLRLDVRSLLQSDAITEVEMEVVSDTELEKTIGENEVEDEKGGDKCEESEEQMKKEEEDEDEPGVSSFVKSRWDHFENSEQNLDRLDGLKRRREGFHATMEEYLQLPDDLDNQIELGPGKKRVRWADLEERRQQEKMRAIGFVVGQTDWNRMTDPTFGENALTRTKYI